LAFSSSFEGDWTLFRSMLNKILKHDPEKWRPVFRKDHAPVDVPAASGTTRLSCRARDAEETARQNAA
jgi:hypothetical protein